MAGKTKSGGPRGSGPKSAPVSYFSLLGREEIRAVLKYLSARPLNPNWTAYISPIDAYNVMREGSALAAPLRRELVASGLCSMSVKGTIPSGPELACPTDTDLGKRIFEILATGIGPTFERLAIDFPSSQFRDIDLLRQHCAHLKVLRVSAKINLAPFLRQCEGKLRELDVSGDTLTKGNVFAVAENCAGLTTLKIDYNKIEGDLPHLWETVGPTLEELSMRMPQFVDENGESREDAPSPFDAIGEHCVKLVTLDIGGARRFRTSFLRMCFKRGEHIKMLRFNEMGDCPDLSDIPRIKLALLNARFDVPINWDQADTLKKFGDRLAVLRIDGRPFEDMEEAGAAMEKLEKAHIRIMEYAINDFLAGVFCNPSLHLRDLFIESTQYQHDSNMFDVLADRVKTIEHFRFSVHATFDGSFWNFAAANTGLRTVWVDFKMDGLPLNNVVLRYNAECEALRVVKDFAQCPKLEELTVSNRFLSANCKAIAQGCAEMGRKGLDVLVGGTQYASSIQR